MKYIQRTSKNIENNFLVGLLEDRGIISKEKEKKQLALFFHPTREINLEDPRNLDNMKEGFALFKKHLENGNKFYYVIDSDVDGATSSAIMINYMKDNLKDLYPDITIDFHVPDGKTHGLSTLMNLFESKKKCDLIICPDSASNDYEEHKKLKELGYDILVLDHHLCPRYSEDAVVINNQLSKNYSNKELSGVGVAYKFLQYCDTQFGFDKAADKYLDLVAFGVISDMCKMTTPENRFICDYGLSHINNPFLLELIEKQSHQIDKNSLTQIDIAFYITPLVNALIRVGNPYEKYILFQSFIDGDKEVSSTKRGEKDKLEKISTQSARNCVNAKARQNREKEKALEILDIQIVENCLDENKILILNADELDVSNNLTGLIAMGVSAKYKKPVILGRTNSDGFFKGSMRGRNESELKDFRQFLLDSGYMDYVEGHNNAAGASLKTSNIEKLYTYANKELADINFNEGFYEADFIVNGNCSYLSNLIEELDDGKKFFGQGCDEPNIVVENIVLNVKDISIIGQNKDTVRFLFNGVTYIKFKAKSLIEEISRYKGKISITVVGRSNINEWGGYRKPQLLVDGIEIKEINDYDF